MRASRWWSTWSPISNRAPRSRGLRLSNEGSGGDAEAADFFEQRLHLSAIGWRRRARQPELLEGVGPVFGMLGSKCGHRLGSFARAAGERKGGHQEELRTAVAGIALQGFMKQLNRCFSPPEQQFSKSAEEEPDAVLAIRSIQAHGALDRGGGFVGATEKGSIIPGKAVVACQLLIHG